MYIFEQIQDISYSITNDNSNMFFFKYSNKNTICRAFTNTYEKIFFDRVNSVSTSQIGGEGITDGFLGVMGSRIWFFIGLMLSFCSVIGACWILFGGYVIPSKNMDSFFLSLRSVLNF